jgi:hypothetical protein
MIPLTIKKTLTDLEQRKRDELEQKPKQGHRDDFDASTVYDWDIMGKRLDELEELIPMHLTVFSQLKSLEDRFTALLNRQTEQEYDWDVMGKRLDDLDKEWLERQLWAAKVEQGYKELYEMQTVVQAHFKSLEDRFTALLNRQTEQEKELSEKTGQIETLKEAILTMTNGIETLALAVKDMRAMQLLTTEEGQAANIRDMRSHLSRFETQLAQDHKRLEVFGSILLQGVSLEDAITDKK